MNASVPFPTHLHWTAQQLADAVPLRLHELFVTAVADAASAPRAANPGRVPARRAPGYLGQAAMPVRFQIR